MPQQTCLILLGPPGAGKGTQAEILAEEKGYLHISSGELFRKNLENETELGKKAARYIDAGELVPDEITIGMVENRIQEIEPNTDFILDGFPRTLGQAKALSEILKKYDPEVREVVLYLHVSYSELIERLTGRLTCRAHGHVFHKKYNPPKEEGICDYDGSELYQREDDQLETVKNRVDVYIEKTKPLISYYRDRGILVEVDAGQDVEAVAADIEQKLDQ
ncbi:MAG: adenylate kinase [Anaerolineales bacterium]